MTGTESVIGTGCSPGRTTSTWIACAVADRLVVQPPDTTVATTWCGPGLAKMCGAARVTLRPGRATGPTGRPR